MLPEKTSVYSTDVWPSEGANVRVQHGTLPCTARTFAHKPAGQRLSPLYLYRHLSNGTGPARDSDPLRSNGNTPTTHPGDEMMTTRPAAPTRAARQYAQAYARMATEANYRPGAPSDGIGHVTVPSDRLEPLHREALRYGQRFAEEEETHQFHVGCPDGHDAAALMFIIEAARQMCGCQQDLAVQLLRMAADDIASRLS